MPSEVLQQVEDLITQSQKPFLTFKEAQQYLDCSASHLYKLTCFKNIPHYKKGKRLFFKRDELDNWLLQNPIKTIEQIDQQATDYVTMNGGG